MHHSFKPRKDDQKLCQVITFALKHKMEMKIRRNRGGAKKRTRNKTEHQLRGLPRVYNMSQR